MVPAVGPAGRLTGPGGSVAALALTVDPVPLVVARFPASSAWPAPRPSATGGPAFFSVTRSGDELSVVAPASDVPDVPGGSTGHRPEWRRLVVNGPLDLSLVGIVAGLSGVLAAAGISLFPVATHDTDHLLVPADQLDRAVGALLSAGHRVAWPDGPASTADGSGADRSGPGGPRIQGRRAGRAARLSRRSSSDGGRARVSPADAPGGPVRRRPGPARGRRR